MGKRRSLLPLFHAWRTKLPGRSRLSRLRGLVAAVMAWEQLCLLAWPAASLVAAFVALALLDLPAQLPWFGQALLLSVSLGAVSASLWRLRHWHWPDAKAVDRRIEQDNGLRHQPLALLADHLAGAPTSTASRRLWAAAQQRGQQSIHDLHLGPTRPQLPMVDPIGWRFLAALLLAIGLLVGGPEAGPRLRRALWPPVLSGPPVTIEAWITPPDYTGLPPQSLDPANPAAVAIPIGSRLTVALQGGRGRAHLLLDGHSTKFQAIDPQSQHLDTTIRAGDRLTLRQAWHSVATWPITIIPDQPPTIALTHPPDSDSEQRLQLALRATDDYGLRRLGLDIHRASDPTGTPPMHLLLIDGGKSKQLDQVFHVDLASHRWAGQAVTVVIWAEDGAGQRAQTSVVALVLPERIFHHPIARAVIALRHDLLDSPADRSPVLAGLGPILEQPERFGGDLTAFLALTDANARLFYDARPEAVDGVIDLLWEAALRIEQQQPGQEQRAFDDAAADLANALNNNASPDELLPLLERFRAALAKRLASLPKMPANAHIHQPMQILQTKDLLQMLKAMEDMMKTGSGKAAGSLLSQLKGMMDGLQGSGGQPDMTPGDGPSLGLDPFGRPLGGTGFGDTVKIPTDQELGKAKAILDELRQRSNDRQRSPTERDYLDRLLNDLY